MPKIAGYMLLQHIDQGDEWLNAVDPKSIGPISTHRQCAWNEEALHCIIDAEVEIVSTISLEDADKHVCGYCRDRLSDPAYFHFEAEYKRLHETIGWIQTISHEEMYSSDGYRDVVDAIHIVCRDCESRCPDGYYCLERIESKDYRCRGCNIRMNMIGKECMKQSENGATDTIQLFHFDQLAPGYWISVVSGGLRKKWHREVYELHELADAEALYDALMKVCLSKWRA